MKSFHEYARRSGLYGRNRGSDAETGNSEGVFDHAEGELNAEMTNKDNEVSWCDDWGINNDEGTLTYHNVILAKRACAVMITDSGPDADIPFYACC